MSSRAWLGLGFVGTVTFLVTVMLLRVPGARTLGERLVDHATGRLVDVRVAFDAPPALRLGDPVYTVEGQAFAGQGRIIVIDDGPPCTVTIAVDPSLARRLHDQAGARAMTPGSDLAWVLRTLVPPPLRNSLIEELGTVWEARRKETLTALRPHLLALLGDVTQVLARTLPEVLGRHSAERDAFLRALREEIYAVDLEPVLKTEVLSRLEQRVGGVAAEVGAEIWAAMNVVDIMGIAWSATKESVGVARDKEVSDRLGRLLEKKALPVIKERAPDLLRAAGAAIVDAIDQPAVREAIDRAAWKTLEHPAFQRFAGAVLDEWLIKNPELGARLADATRSRALREPLTALYQAAEPLLEQSLEEVLTRPDRKGLDHQLARVLRHVVLRKDDRYLLIHDAGSRPFDPRRHVLAGQTGEDP